MPEKSTRSEKNSGAGEPGSAGVDAPSTAEPATPPAQPTPTEPPGVEAPGVELPGVEPQGVEADVFREALAHWASGVTVVTVRDPDDGKIYGTTVSSLVSVSATPPRIAFSLGPGAQVLPFLKPGRRFVVNILAEEQDELADRFTDPFPVGVPAFPPEGDPTIAGSHQRLICRVDGFVPVGPSRIVVGLVVGTQAGEGRRPLLYHQRGYRGLAEGVTDE